MENSNLFILDIETKPNPELVDLFCESIKPDARTKDPDKIAAQIEEKKSKARKSMSVDPDYCKIVCIGIKRVGGNKQQAILTPENLCDFFCDEPDAELVTFNGRQFDIPALIKTGVREGIDYPFKKLLAMTDKYHPKAHHDLQDILSFYSDMSKVKSLDAYLRIYLGIQKKTLGDEFFNTATDDDLKVHCLEDLQYTEKLLNKFMFLIK